MVEKHYGHLAPSFITEAIRARAAVFGLWRGSVLDAKLREPRPLRAVATLCCCFATLHRIKADALFSVLTRASYSEQSGSDPSWGEVRL